MSTSSGGTRSLGTLVSDVSEQVSGLVRAEIELAKAELAARAKRLGIGTGLLVAAAVLAVYLVPVALATAIIALAIVWPLWLASLVVLGALLLVIALLVALGVNRLKHGSPPSPTRAIENVLQDVDAVKAGFRS